MKPSKNPPRLPEAEIAARVIRNFVVKHRQARYLGYVAKANPTGGYGFGELAHFIRELDPRFCQQIPSGSQYSDAVLQQIQALTQTTECYVMHESPKLDGQWMSLPEALRQIVGRNLGAIIAVDNGEIIYHESEAPKQRYIGVRRAFQ